MSKQLSKLKSIAKKLRAAQEQAASIELTLGNGALIDNLVGGIADEVEALIALQETHPLAELPLAARKMWS